MPDDEWQQWFERVVKSAPVRKMMEGGVTLDILVESTTIAEDVWVEDGDTFSYNVARDSI